MPFGICQKNPSKKLYQLTFGEVFQGKLYQLINGSMSIF